MKSHRLAALAAALLILAPLGCLPEKRVVWSPDGRRAAVTSAAGLFIIDEDGKVLPPRLTNTPTRCDWFPDGRRLAVVHATTAKRWEDLAPIYMPEQVQQVERAAKALRVRVLAFEGAWDHFDLDPDKNLPIDVELGSVVYLRDNDAEGLAEKVGTHWADIRDLECSVWTLQVFTLTDETLTPQKTLVRTLAELRRPTVDPAGRNIAYLRSGNNLGEEALALDVVSTDGGPAREVSANAAMDFDWSPDGSSLAFIESPITDKNAERVQLGSLTTVRVAATDGKLLSDWEKREQRVGLLFSPTLGAAWLKDGRLLFSSVEVRLPATSREMPQEWSLFALDPRMPAGVTRVLGRDLDATVDMSMSLFALSPDETRVLLPGPKGRWSVYDFASGATAQLVVRDDPKGHTRALAAWRNNDDICYVAPVPSDDGPPAVGVFLRHGKKSRLISGDWPDEMKAGWLND